MTIYTGTAVASPSKLTINPPQGFGAIDGVRLTNYTGFVLKISNISSTSGGSTEYLFPRQQMVYHTRNISAVPTVDILFLGLAPQASRLFVEWTDDAINDFIGTYPAFVPQTLLTDPEVGVPVSLSIQSAPTVLTATFANFGANAAVNFVPTAPYTVPAGGFELDITSLEVSAFNGGAVVAQFRVSLANIVAGVIAERYASAPFAIQAGGSQNMVLPFPFDVPLKLATGQTPVFIYETGPALVSFSAVASGIQIPVN